MSADFEEAHGIMGEIQEVLSPDLLRDKFRGGAHRLAGHCYVASEALYHLLGGRAAGWTPEHIKHEGVSHWYLRHASGEVLDPTVAQFSTTPDYRQGCPKGFLTRNPSKRACVVLSRLATSSDVTVLSSTLKEPHS